MNKPYVSSVFENDKHEYDKETASTTGTSAKNSKQFQENVMSYISAVKDGSFLAGGIKKLNLSLQALLEKGLGLLGLSKLKESLLSKLDNTPFSIKSVGLNGLVKLLTISEKIFGNLVQQIAGALLSKIFIPDPVYLASLVAFDVAGADLEVNNNYIRKLIIRRDITVALKWWNKTWGITYTGLRSDHFTSDAFLSARYGCYKNVEYILNEFKNSYHIIMDSVSLIPVIDKPLNEMTEQEVISYRKRLALLQSADNVYTNMIITIKELIISSYSNFKADDLRSLLKKTNISPSIFGFSDQKYGSKYAINLSDVNKCAPFYTMKNNSTLSDVEELTNIRSSRYRRKYNKKRTGKAYLSPTTSKSHALFKYINPRNRNIKRLYLVLVSSEFESPMYNPIFAERLQYKIANVFLKSLAASDLIPNSIFKSQQELWYSAYDYTKNVEDFLFDPSKVSDLKFADTDVIKMPKEIEVKTSIINDAIESKQDLIIRQQRNERHNHIINTIGPVLVRDKLMYDVNTYMNQPFIEGPIYDKAGNRVIRDEYGGFIRANEDGTLLLDELENPISVNIEDVSIVPKEKRDPKNVLPENLKDYIERTVDQYLSLNLNDIINSLLLKIKNGDIILYSNDAIERLAFNNYKNDGGIFYNEMNVNQTLPIIIEKIRTNEISIETLKNTPLTEIINNVINDLITNELYESVFNNEENINIVKLSITNLQNNINDIKNGKLDPTDIPTYSEIKNQAIEDNFNGIIATIGELTDELFLATKKLNDILVNFKKSNVDQVTYEELLGQYPSFDDIIKEYKDQIDEGKYVPITTSQYRIELMKVINNTFENIKNNIINILDIPTFNELNEEAIQNVENKYDLSEIMEILKNFGIDLTGYDIMEYYRELDKKVNEVQDEELYDFDVNNPPSKVIKSLEDEYNERENFKFKYYRWINNIEI